MAESGSTCCRVTDSPIRLLNRLGHKLHLHYMPPIYIEGDTLLRCAWCGVSHVTRPMRTPTSVDKLSGRSVDSRAVCAH